MHKVDEPFDIHSLDFAIFASSTTFALMVLNKGDNTIENRISFDSSSHIYPDSLLPV